MHTLFQIALALVFASLCGAVPALVVAALFDGAVSLRPQRQESPHPRASRR
jgi:hypothetical protein